MPGLCFIDDNAPDECDLARDKRAWNDAVLANAYANGRAAGLQGLSTAGRPEDDEESREFLKGYLSGLAQRHRGRA